MTLDLTCQACDASFELDVGELLDEPRIQCPSCDARAPIALSEALSTALDDLFGRVAKLRPKFEVVFEVESDDLPPPYDRPRVAAGADDDEADEEEDEEDEEDAEREDDE